MSSDIQSLFYTFCGRDDQFIMDSVDNQICSKPENSYLISLWYIDNWAELLFHYEYPLNMLCKWHFYVCLSEITDVPRQCYRA